MYDILVLRSSNKCFVVLADNVSFIGQSSSQGTSSTSPEQAIDRASEIDLNAYLNLNEDEQKNLSPKEIVVKIGEDFIVYRTNASLNMSRVAADDFYHLPYVLRESGCAKWVRGAALLESRDHNEKKMKTILAIWIDLRILGKELPSKGKELIP